MPNYYFIIDVESIGLHGEAFAVAAQIFDRTGSQIPTKGGWWHSTKRDYAQGTKQNREWVEKNMPELKVSYLSRRELREHFWAEWIGAKSEYPGIVMAAECSWPVEARFLSECIADSPDERDFEGPYPLHDIASIMLAAGMDPMATYPRADAEYPIHHPLGDVQHSGHCLKLALQRLKVLEAA